MARKKEKTQIFKKNAGIIFLARIFNKDFFETYQNITYFTCEILERRGMLF